MTIDEAIEYLKYDIEIDMYILDIAPQIAQWLEELKDYRDKNKMVVRVDVENIESVKDKINKLSKEQYNKGYADGSLSVTSEIRNKAIDDFVEHITLPIITEEDISRIVEQVKEGGENGTDNQ